jgi:hypothetical protein
LAGLVLTSATGAKSWLIPMARSSRPMTDAAARVSEARRPAPRALVGVLAPR